MKHMEKLPFKLYVNVRNFKPGREMIEWHEKNT